jgi:hypothetical protein
MPFISPGNCRTTSDALIILECARGIVERFIAEAPPPNNGARVVYLAHPEDG